MQSIFHVQHYSFVDGHVIWNAEFEDMVLLSKKDRRIVDQRKVSEYRLTWESDCIEGIVFLNVAKLVVLLSHIRFEASVLLEWVGRYHYLIEGNDK